jgi:hypothetical protein
LQTCDICIIKGSSFDSQALEYSTISILLKAMAVLLRTTTIILLNQTNEELVLDIENINLKKCSFLRNDKLPQNILAGEYGTWKVKGSHPFSYLQANLSFNVCGSDPTETINIHCRDSIWEKTAHDGTYAPDRFSVRILGGGGLLHSVWVVVLGMSFLLEAL